MSKFKSRSKWISTTTYEGYMKEDLPDRGRGFFTYLNGDFLYYGEWTKGGNYHNGIGKKTLSISGNTYSYFIGGWKNGIMTGLCIIIKFLNGKQITRINEIRDDVIVKKYIFRKTMIDFNWNYNYLHMYIYKLFSDNQFYAW